MNLMIARILKRSPTSVASWFCAAVVLPVAVTNCGGSVGDSTGNSTGNSTGHASAGSGGATTTGGTTGTGGTTTVAGGGNPCASAPSMNPVATSGCHFDSDCSEGQYCDTENCTSPCGCQDGSYVCVNLCAAKCVAIACPTPDANLAMAVAGRSCDVVLRVNADASQILSYRATCGTQNPLTQEAAWNLLLPISRINWSTATPYGAADSGYLFVHESAPYDVVAIGPTTGQVVFEFTSDGTTSSVMGDWNPAPGTDGSCQSSAAIPSVTLGPWSSTLPQDAILQLLYEKGILGGLSQGNGGYNSIALVQAPLVVPEYFVIIGTTPRV